MASQVYKKGGNGELGFNLTPMIDCTFQLILFFILSTQVASEAIARLDLHRPVDSQARNPKDVGATHKVIVNVLSAEPEKGSVDPMLAGLARCYRIENEEFRTDDVNGLVAAFERKKAAADTKQEPFYLEIRADKKVAYHQVQNVLAAAEEAKIPKMNIAALLRVQETREK